MSYNGIHGSVGGRQGHHFSGPVNAGRVDRGHYGRHAVAARKPQPQNRLPRALGFPNKPLHARKAAFRPNNEPGYLKRAGAIRVPRHQPHPKPVYHAPAHSLRPYPLPGLSAHGQQNIWSSFQPHSAPSHSHTQYFNPAQKQQVPDPDNWQRPAPVKNYPQAHVAPARPGLDKAADKSRSEPTYSSIEDLDSPSLKSDVEKPALAESPAPAKKWNKRLKKRLIAVLRKKSPSKEDLQVTRNLKQGVIGPRASNTYEASKSVAAKKEQPLEEPIYAKVDKAKKLRERAVRPLEDPQPPKRPEGEYEPLAPRVAAQAPVYEPLKLRSIPEEDHIYDTITPRDQPVGAGYDTIPLKSGSNDPHHEKLKHRPLPSTPPDEKTDNIYDELKFDTKAQPKSAGQNIYDTPTKGAGVLKDPVYDTPTNNKKAPEENIYDVPKSLLRERSDSLASLGAVSTASTDPGISEDGEFSDLSELESLLDNTSSLSSAEIDLGELDQMGPAVAVAVANPKPSKKAFKKLLEKKKKAAQELYKEQMSYDKSVKVYLNTLRKADEAFLRGDRKDGNKLINQAFDELEKVREKTAAIQFKVTAAIVDVKEIEESAGSSKIPEWVRTYGNKATGQSALNGAVHDHYIRRVGIPLRPYNTYGQRVIEQGKAFTDQFLLFTGRVQ